MLCSSTSSETKSNYRSFNRVCSRVDGIGRIEWDTNSGCLCVPVNVDDGEDTGKCEALVLVCEGGAIGAIKHFIDWSRLARNYIWSAGNCN